MKGRAAKLLHSLSIVGAILYSASFFPAVAHHSVVAHYLIDEKISVSGIVTEFWFENPHARILVDATDDSGESVRWVVETGSRNNLIRRGWTGEEIKPGDRVHATGLPSRDGSPTMELRELDMDDGRQYRREAGALRLVENN